VFKSALLSDQIRVSEPNGDVSIMFVRLAKLKVFALRKLEDSLLLTKMVRGTFTSTGKLGEQRSFSITMCICPGPMNAFPFHAPLTECFYLTIPASMSARRDDVLSKWYSITNHYIQPLLPDVVSMAVLWVPSVSKEGIITQDRFVIGTYSDDQYHDVVKGIVFDSDPVENSCLLINGTMVRFSSHVLNKVSLFNFPSKPVSVVVHMVRGSKLPLDYIRDLVYNMGVPEGELLDVVYEGTVLSIVCSSLYAAAVLIRRGPAFAPAGIDGWKMILKDACLLPEVLDSMYPITGNTPTLQEYPGSIFAVKITRAFIGPIVQAQQKMDAQLPLVVLPPKLGPQFKVIKILPRPQQTEAIMEVVMSQVQNVSVSPPSSQPAAPGVAGDVVLSDELKFWINILVSDDLAIDGHYYLANVVRRELSRSPAFREIVVSMFTNAPLQSDSAMQEDEVNMNF
jgi:hypothetical protein